MTDLTEVWYLEFGWTDGYDLERYAQLSHGVFVRHRDALNAALRLNEESRAESIADAERMYQVDAKKRYDVVCKNEVLVAAGFDPEPVPFLRPMEWYIKSCSSNETYTVSDITVPVHV